LPLARAASAVALQQKLVQAGVLQQDTAAEEFSIKTFTSPADAFANAQSRAGENDRIVVFGSFLTVAGVLEARKSGSH
ncbi:MAG: bifunctional folylpolyglutamate synthase/dihydrofolate synthase, partial [bacterium]